MNDMLKGLVGKRKHFAMVPADSFTLTFIGLISDFSRISMWGYKIPIKTHAN